ncbi:MAG TPA: thiamine phosphate synthase [Clostridiales bacterium]|nr:thiamine phosphate synthase [Clostridiales bacterium]
MKSKENFVDYSLYLVTERQMLRNISMEEAVEQAILGGVTLVQLREKDVTTLEFYNIAVKVKKITDKYSIPLIINDRLDIALAVDAAGLHVGQSDMPAKVARKILGDNKILGVSAATINEALQAVEDGADYIGTGAVFATDTKKDAKYVNIRQLKEITGKISIPVVAIGGINEDNIDILKGTGIKGVAVVSAIMGKENIRKASENLKKTWETCRKGR